MTKDAERKVSRRLTSYFGTCAQVLTAIAAILSVSVQCLRNWWHDFQVLQKQKADRVRGPKACWDLDARAQHIEYIKNLTDIDPSLFAHEISKAVRAQFHVLYTESQIKQIWQRDLNYTVTDLEHIAYERNEALRSLWRDFTCNNMERYPACMYEFLDETHLAQEETVRRRGRSPMGQRAFVRNNHPTPDKPVS